MKHPKLDFEKIKSKYPDSGIYVNGNRVKMMAFSFVRVDNGLNVRFYVNGENGGIPDRNGEPLSSECFIEDAEYCALVDGELINIENEVLESFCE
ncbi:hypothetical protein TW1_007 [Pseudoalteromonas phage TW1]|uniref:hypothetical protein n=1 Tax=Pseudoalteromonas phage TW1 TaxID=1366055 RepID=UPI00035AADC8|nr:hypothetical protein PP585_gp07 [Pseudoalteromonas phage TW1]AGR46523.1 hypothetical protein TW1_007 [Pseudoalteromonas phage TW1]